MVAPLSISSLSSPRLLPSFGTTTSLLSSPHRAQAQFYLSPGPRDTPPRCGNIHGYFHARVKARAPTPMPPPPAPRPTTIPVVGCSMPISEARAGHAPSSVNRL
ncbi:hypothetical protein VPH35_078486 [Triticum aestivum]